MSLVMIILLIILVPSVPFFCLLKKRKWKFWLDESSLHVQPLFWFLVFLPLIISGITWVLVAQDYELDVSTRGYSRLMENAKFPFLILALSPILGAFVTSAHRSLQTELQIKTAKDQLEEAQKKNKVDLYIAKRKYMYEQISYMKTIDNEKVSNPPLLCFEAFSNSNFIDVKNNEFIKSMNLLFIKLNEILVELDEYKFPEENMFFNIHKDIILNGSEVYRIHPFYYLDSQIKAIKNFIHVKISDSKNNSLIYPKFCDAVEEIKNNSKGNIVIDKEIYLFGSENKIIMNDFIKKMVELLDDFLSFTHSIISIIYMEGDINKFLPILKVSKDICEEWKIVVREM